VTAELLWLHVQRVQDKKGRLTDLPIQPNSTKSRWRAQGCEAQPGTPQAGGSSSWCPSIALITAGSSSSLTQLYHPCSRRMGRDR
jgi:hypothetical protein